MLFIHTIQYPIRRMKDTKRRFLSSFKYLNNKCINEYLDGIVVA